MKRLLMASNRQTERGEKKTKLEGGMDGKSMKDKQKQTQASRVIEAVGESCVRQSTLWRKQQLVCSLRARHGLWNPQA